MTSTTPLLRVDNLHFSYPDRAVFSGLSFDWAPGLACVCGDESSGKTTLLRLLAGELSPSRGRILLTGQGGICSTPMLADQLFYVEPRSSSLDQSVAGDWLAAQAARYPAWDAHALAEHVQGFGLADHLAKPFFALSTGTRRKVCQAAALASGAAVTLMDDPHAGLDKPSMRYLAEVLVKTALSVTRIVVFAHYEALPGLDGAQVLTLQSPNPA